MTRLMLRTTALLLATLLSTATLLAEPPSEAAAGATPALLLGDGYPLEATVSFPAALLHWLDSLAHMRGAGMTAGKTVEAHRQTYVEYLGVPSDEDQRLLEKYHRVRSSYASGAAKDRNALTRAFFEASDLDDALTRAAGLLDERDRTALSEATRHFAPGYRRIWKDGEIPNAFLERASRSKARDDLAQFLDGVAKFYGVDPAEGPRPRLILTPVPSGVGTHAQAIDEFLLVEIRKGDGLRQQIAPIVHENAHLLYHRMGQERIDALQAAALAHGIMGTAAWQHLKEALPTAIAQGVSQVVFRVEGWSLTERWYDFEMVDVFAKKIFPNVKRALSTGGKLDPALIDEFVVIYERSVAPRRAGAGATPRSP